MNVFSDKQVEYLKRTSARRNIAWGSVRSGKSVVSNYRFLNYCTEGPKGDLLISGKTERTIRRNIIAPIKDIIGSDLRYNAGLGECYIGGRKCVVRGGNDERASEKIQGDTYVGGIIDEITLLPKSFWKMLISRMSVDGAQLFGSTNTDSPFHWLKTEVLDNSEIDLYDSHFTIDDNPFLSKKFVDDLKKDNTGLWYDRYIKGLWTIADGVIYDCFDSDIHIIDTLESDYKYSAIGVDYGIATTTAFVKLQWNTKNNIHITDEYYYDYTVTNRQKTDEELADEMEKFTGGKRIEIFADPSATSFIASLRKRGMWVKLADNAVLEGIRFVAGMLSKQELKVHKSCENLIKEKSSYIWDAKAQLKGETKPVKNLDHALDAERYVCYSKFARGTPVIG